MIYNNLKILKIKIYKFSLTINYKIYFIKFYKKKKIKIPITVYNNNNNNILNLIIYKF